VKDCPLPPEIGELNYNPSDLCIFHGFYGVDRHVSIVHDHYFYVFGGFIYQSFLSNFLFFVFQILGFDGTSRVNDFYQCDLNRKVWSPVAVNQGVLFVIV